MNDTLPLSPELHVSRYCLVVLPAGHSFRLDNGREYIIGRAVEGQPVRPDIDLTPFNAFDEGVSRFHASIMVHNQVPIVFDLGSTNGSRLNNTPLVPYEPRVLKEGDILVIGNLRCQLLESEGEKNLPN